MRKYYTESRRRGILLLKRRKANWVSHIMRGKYLLKHITGGKIAGRIKRREDEEEGINSYWITLRKRDDTGN